MAGNARLPRQVRSMETPCYSHNLILQETSNCQYMILNNVHYNYISAVIRVIINVFLIKHPLTVDIQLINLSANYQIGAKIRNINWPKF